VGGGHWHGPVEETGNTSRHEGGDLGEAQEVVLVQGGLTRGCRSLPLPARPRRWCWFSSCSLGGPGGVLRGGLPGRGEVLACAAFEGGCTTT
jgi:hypothetical protein